MILQVRVKFPSDYPVIYKTIRLDNSLTVQEAILAIGEAINVTPSSDLGLFLPDEAKCLADTSLLSSYEQFQNASYIELKSKKSAKGDNSNCCTIM
ncbi:hypothetical protein DICPUDRAFT_93203 [Dictyostelium purpureum]|uniref:Ubiquitin-like domain-containing protein n=1 Tax=Dictyostelium purpureum TaxID=5786 RepID=F1A3W1_DICPU|nr:uncharacterized protein DICPUDRAFT_93203 [Dictyostelium purpureum]EGC29115.1 hypothetical protein DICPUDRAFT_93203 [Dictyostelium purpureum]|eukprot:XP_003294355.1 hypothetical protein DICPUDRAFT_93203 [Dictyostelium purpureum]